MSQAIKSKNFDTLLLYLKAPEQKEFKGLVSPQFRSNTMVKIVLLMLKVISKYFSMITKERNLTL